MLLSEKAMAPHSSTLAWKIPWMGEPGRLQSMGSLRVGHDWATSLSIFTFMHWRRQWQPTPVFLPGESQGWGSLVGCHLWGRTESDTTEVTWQLAAACCYRVATYAHSLANIWTYHYLIGIYGLIPFFFFFKLKPFYLVLGYSWLTMLWQFRVNSKGTQSYIYLYPFSPQTSPHPGWHITLSRVPCAMQ